MIPRSLPLLLFVACLCGAPSLLLHAQQAPPVDPKSVLATLKDLRAKQTGIIVKEKSDVLAAINAALADPGKAYEQAMQSVELQGKPPAPRGPGRVTEVRKREDDQVRDRGFVAGLRCQLLYLNLTWQRCMGAKTRDLLPALLDYTAQVSANLDALSALDMFRKPIGESVFVNYFQVGPYINGVTDWSDHPFDVESIYQKTILPEMRKNRDPRLLAYWDNHVQSEATHASDSQNNLTISRFNHVRRPSLLWSRAEDEMVLGNNNQAVADMLTLLKANPDHPDFDKWAAELEGIVAPKAEPPVPVGEVTVGPATLATPTPGLP